MGGSSEGTANSPCELRKFLVWKWIRIVLLGEHFHSTHHQIIEFNNNLIATIVGKNTQRPGVELGCLDEHKNHP